MSRSSTAPFPAPGHDHAPCLADTLERARGAFDRVGLRLTPLRARVLEEIAASHSAVGAYEVLDRLARSGRRLAPISVYRAIEALVEAGLVHKLETRNAFFACHSSHLRNRGHLVLACDRCNTVAEVPGATAFASIMAAAEAMDFSVTHAVVEVRGVCHHCGAAGDGGSGK